jgi:hypothetical protein
MALHVPPVATETDAIHAFLAQAQDAFRALLHGLTPRQAALAPSASSLSIGGLVQHATMTQRSWLDSAVSAPELPASGDVADHLEGFTFRETDSLEDLVAAYDEVSAAVLDAVRRLDLDTPVPVPDAPWFPKDVPAWSVRWVWWHLVEELARHAGHGDIVRETLDGATMYSLVAARGGVPDLPWLPVWKPQESPFTSGVSTVRLHAADVPAATAWYADLLGRGATVHEDLRDFGGGYRGAVVIDPFGNALGIMQRPVAPTTGSPERKGEAA